MGLYRGYSYHIFRTPGTLTPVTPGMAEAVAIPGGGGGGSGAGGGGGGGVPIRTNKPFIMDAALAVTPGAGGLGGTAGGNGQPGEDSTLGEILRARGGGGGAGKGLVAQNSPISGGGGGGGNADAATSGAEPGACSATLGGAEPGGSGHGFDSSGTPIAYGGGGGGARGRGEKGATQEVTGNPLTTSWDLHSGLWAINQALQRLSFEANPGRITHLSVSRGEMLVSGKLTPRVSVPVSGTDFALLTARHDGAVSPGHGYGIGFSRGSVATDLRLGLRLLNGTGLPSSLVTHTKASFTVQEYELELYVADGVQEAWVRAADGNVYTLSATDTTHDGNNDHSAGFYNDSAQISDADEFRTRPSKYLIVSGLSTGESVRVLDGNDEVVASASEAGGQASVPLSNFSTGRARPSEGYQTIQVLDAGLSVVAEYVDGGVHPGAEMTRSGSAIAFDTSGDDLLDGLVAFDNFDGVTPGPEHGDGGEGVNLLDFFLNGNVIKSALEGAGNNIISWDAAGDDGADVDVVIELRPGDVLSGIKFRLMARQDPLSSTLDCYMIELRANGSVISEFRLVRLLNGAFQQFDTTAAVSFSTTDNVRLRLQCIGTTVRGKIWKYPDAEPGTWLRTATDSNHVSGQIMVETRASDYEISYISVNKAGGTTPDPEQVATEDDIRTFFEDQTPGTPVTGWTPFSGQTADLWHVVGWPGTSMIAPVVTGDDGYFGGGGGGGSESVISGKGGRGGGGDGSFTGAGEDGTDDTGGGGGGSHETIHDGGDGGDGIVVVRTELVA